MNTEDRLTALEGNVVEQACRIVALEAQIAASPGDEISTTARIEELAESNRNLADRIERRDAEVGVIQGLLRGTQQENDRLRAALAAREEELAGALKEHDRLKRDIADLHVKVSETEPTRIALCEALGVSSSSGWPVGAARVTQKAAKDHFAEVERLRDDAEIKGASIAALRAVAENNATEIMKLRAEIEIGKAVGQKSAPRSTWG